MFEPAKDEGNISPADRLAFFLGYPTVAAVAFLVGEGYGCFILKGSFSAISFGLDDFLLCIEIVLAELGFVIQYARNYREGYLPYILRANSSIAISLILCIVSFLFAALVSHSAMWPALFYFLISLASSCAYFILRRTGRNSSEGDEHDELRHRVRFVLLWPSIYSITISALTGYYRGCGRKLVLFFTLIAILSIIYLLYMFHQFTPKENEEKPFINARHPVAVIFLVVICALFEDPTPIIFLIVTALFASFEAWNIIAEFAEKLDKVEDQDGIEEIKKERMELREQIDDYCIAANVAYLLMMLSVAVLTPVLYGMNGAPRTVLGLLGQLYSVSAFIIVFASMSYAKRAFESNRAKIARRRKIVASLIVLSVMALLALYGEDFAYMDACLEFLESIMTPLASGGIGAVGVINCLSLPVTFFKSSRISSKLKNCLVGLGVESKDKLRMRITEKESYAPTKFRWIFVWYVGTTSSLLIYIGFLLSYSDISQDFALAFFTTGSFLVAISIVFRIIAELCWPKEKQCARA